MFKNMSATLLFASLALFSSLSSAGVMSIRVSGIQDLVGNVRVAIYNSPGIHLSEQTFHTAVAAVSGNEILLKVENIPYGVYSMAAIHDADLNGTMTKNFLGIPKELFGFSNGALPSLRGAPSFDESKINFSDDSQEFDITLRGAF